MLQQQAEMIRLANEDMKNNFDDLSRGIQDISQWVVQGITERLEAVVKDFQREIKYNASLYTTDQLSLMKLALKSASQSAKIKLFNPEIWYVARSDVLFDAESPFGTSDVRSIYDGTLLYSGTKVTVRTVTAAPDDDTLRQDFIHEVRKWYLLSDPHVSPLYGANDAGSPLLIVCGRAEQGNFNQYLETHPHRLWRVFLDAARGLAYLHSHKIVHANSKCNNLLVTLYGSGMVSDFAFSFARDSSRNLSVKTQTPITGKPPNASVLIQTRVQSDVYSFGMCLFEAISGQVPYSEFAEDIAMRKIQNGELPSRPSTAAMTDEAWALIEAMCQKSYQARPQLQDIIAILMKLSKAEESMEQICVATAA